MLPRYKTILTQKPHTHQYNHKDLYTDCPNCVEDLDNTHTSHASQEQLHIPNIPYR